MNNQLPTNKQQRQILAISILGAFLVSWGSISYLLTHPNFITYIEPPEKVTITTNKKMLSTINENEIDLLTLMQRIQVNPNDVNAFLELSKYFIELSDWNQAKNFALRAIEINPNSLDPLYLLGIIQHNQGDHINAAKSFKKVLEKDTDPSAQYSLALLYLYYLGEKHKALQYLHAVLNNPKSPPEMLTAVDNIFNEIKEELPSTT